MQRCALMLVIALAAAASASDKIEKLQLKSGTGKMVPHSPRHALHEVHLMKRLDFT